MNHYAVASRPQQRAMSDMILEGGISTTKPAALGAAPVADMPIERANVLPLMPLASTSSTSADVSGLEGLNFNLNLNDDSMDTISVGDMAGNVENNTVEGSQVVMQSGAMAVRHVKAVQKEKNMMEAVKRAGSMVSGILAGANIQGGVAINFNY